MREFGWVALILGDLFFVVGWFGGGNDMTSTDTGIYNAYSKLVRLRRVANCYRLEGKACQVRGSFRQARVITGYLRPVFGA